MQKTKELIEEIEVLTTIQNLCLSYEQISLLKIQQIREYVLATRLFYTKLSDVYVNVKSSYKKQIEKILKKNKARGVTLLHPTEKNGKSVSIVLSANTKLHGSIIDTVFDLFTDYISKNETDVIIVGRLGQELYQNLLLKNKPHVKKNYLYFEISDMEIQLEDLKSIVYHLIPYQKINVFYGHYNSMLEQVPQVSSVTGDTPIETKSASETTEKTVFLFEPNLEKILAFFETQIFSALFKQTMHESQLARFASRIKAMEYALNRIDDRHRSIYNEKRTADQMTDNKNQLERIAGISLWGSKL